MKKTLTTLGLGACVLVAFSSCQSTDGDGFGGYEAATPVSAVVGEDQLPPWLLEDSGEDQVAAGSYTSYAIPEPDETVADSGSSVSTRQNQEGLAANSDDIIESDPHDIVVSAPDEARTGALVVTDTPTVATPTVTAPKPIAKPKPTAKPAPKPIVTNKSTKLSPKDKKKVMRVTEPTMITYKVRKGDSLSEIARRSGTTVADIRKASGIKGDTIYAGTTIKVPYTPKGYKALNPSGKAKGQAAKPAKATKHTVRRGETISAIAARYGLTTGQVLKANGLTMAQAGRIRPGQSLSIPGKAQPAKAASATKAKSGKASAKGKAAKSAKSAKKSTKKGAKRR